MDIDENMKKFDISSININSNNKNFLEKNTDTELNKIFAKAKLDKYQIYYFNRNFIIVHTTFIIRANILFHLNFSTDFKSNSWKGAV